jgi:hypothetical protein
VSAINLDDGNSLPQPDADPLVIVGISIHMAWRKKRIMALDEEQITDDLRSAAAAKGVRLISLPLDAVQRAEVMDMLKAALKE